MYLFNSVSLSLLGGVLPSLLWLWFWLKEDRLHPEPKLRVVTVFLVGMVSVLIVLPIEKFIFEFNFLSISIMTVMLWASVEEIIKYIGAHLTALKNKVVDEPIDAVIYMITVALGFSAMENTLFIFNLIDTGQLSQSIITGNSRFLGATLLHVSSSAAIGVMIGITYYKKVWVKKFFLILGIAISILLHTIFNLLIIKLENNLFFIFAGVWVLIILLIVLIEKVKKVQP